MKIGYARVSTQDQTLDVQLEQLKRIGCDKIYQEQASGKSSDREQLHLLLDFAREGDVIHVTKVDRIARNTIDALQIADQLAQKKAGLVFHDLGDLDINSDVGRVIYTTISGSVANFEPFLGKIRSIPTHDTDFLMFKGCHFPSDVILETVRYYLAYKLSYREIEEIQLERGVIVDHATINRWVIKFTPVLEHRARRRKKRVSDSWRMDETYIKVKGKWVYYYRAVDKFGNVVDYYLSPNRDEAAAKAFLNKAIAQNGLPNKVVIDGSKSNYAAIDSMNVQLWLTGYFMLSLVEILDIKYLNNIVEQSHRWVKQKTRQALGWKSTEGALASLHGREVWTMLKQEQIDIEGDTAFERFYALAG